MCSAHASASVSSLPSPLKALRERGIKGESVLFPAGLGVSPQKVGHLPS